MTDNRTTELLPCPCCDSESIKEFAPDEWGDIANPYWKIKCMECGLTMFGTNRRMNQEAWNTRKPEQAIAATLGEPIIRCRDCRHATISTTGVCKYCEMFVLPDVDGYGADPQVNLPLDFFCGFAERKEVD